MHVVKVRTEDGSDTFFVPELNEHYHSVFGAAKESLHIYIESGLHLILQGTEEVHILEIGFGTGLNALLTQIEGETAAKKIMYTAIEPFPLESEAWTTLNYPAYFCSVDYNNIFSMLHRASWNSWELISPFFSVHKLRIRMEEYQPVQNSFNLIYFDAFGPGVQPELWTIDIFKKLYLSLKPGGILMTYSVKGSVTRGMKGAGFSVEKIPGPPGKREITRARKE